MVCSRNSCYVYGNKRRIEAIILRRKNASRISLENLHNRNSKNLSKLKENS